MYQFKDIKVFYFTGTGNARQISRWISEFAIKKKIDCQLIDISKMDIDTLKSFSFDTLIIIISPVHGFNYPKITLDFIRKLPRGDNRVVLMNTRAGMKLGTFVTPGLTGIAFFVSSVILKQKGYKIAGQIPFDMPSNWVSIHPALNQKTVRFIHERNYYRVEKHCDKIFAGKYDFTSYRDLVQDILISPISLGYYLLGRFVLAKSFYASSACDNCGLCVKQCPVSAIKNINEHPFWTFKCESCMKCMSLCPRRAIEAAHGLFVVISILTSIITSFFFDRLLLINIHSGYIRIISLTLIFILLLSFLYRIQHSLLRIGWFAKLISWTSLTHYRFWGRYKSISDDKWKNK